MGKFIDMTGERYGRLVVISLGEKVPRGIHRKWVCKCDCGNVAYVSRQNLINGHTTSCGCYHKEWNTKNLTKHGMSRTRLDNIYHHMMARCYNPKNKSFKDYGGRGVKVCEKWHSCSSFIKWALENGYRKDLTLERINVNGNYEPGNCKWITKGEQAKNKRTSILLEYDGKTQCLAEWCKSLGISYGKALKKYHKGLSVEEILS